MLDIRYVHNDDKEFGLSLISIYLKQSLQTRFGTKEDIYCHMTTSLLVC